MQKTDLNELMEFAKLNAKENVVMRYPIMVLLSTLVKITGGDEKMWAAVVAMHEYHKSQAPEDIRQDLEAIFDTVFSNLSCDSECKGDCKCKDEGEVKSNTLVTETVQ